MSNDITNPPEDFDLFAKDVEDNLQEQLAKGSYKWTNKYTAVLGVLVIITASASAGIWYGNKHAASSTTNGFAGFASRIRGASAGGTFTGAAGATGLPDPAAIAAAGAAGGFGGAGFGGGSRISGTVAKVNGNTLTITLDSSPSTPIAAGDSVSIRNTGSANGANGSNSSTTAGASTASAGSTRNRGSRKSATSSNSQPSAAATASSRPSIGGGGNGGGGNGGGGRFNNPAFTDCLAKNGVTLTPGTRPDRTDPKVAAALQACFATLGGGPGGPGGPGGFGAGARPSPTATP